MNKTELEIVKEKLWKFAYSVKDFSGIEKIPFQLLVERTIRLNITTKKPKTFPLNIEVIAVVQKGRVLFYKEDLKTAYVSPYDVFGRPLAIPKVEDK